MAVTYTPIANYTFASAASTYTFSSIPQTYTDLVIITNVAISSGTGYNTIRVGNNTVDTGTHYSLTTVEGTGTNKFSNRYASSSYIYLNGSGYLNTNFETSQIINIQNYSNTTTYKTFLIRNGGASAGVDAIAAIWRGMSGSSTEAINTITISTTASTFVAGSTLSLYGIAAA